MLAEFPRAMKGQVVRWWTLLLDEVNIYWPALQDLLVKQFRIIKGEKLSLRELMTIVMEEDESIRHYTQIIKALIHKLPNLPNLPTDTLQVEW